MDEPRDTFAYWCCRCGASTLYSVGDSGQAAGRDLCPVCIERDLKATCLTTSLRLLTQAQRLREGEEFAGEDASERVSQDLLNLAGELAGAAERGEEDLH
jgi:hypothetical protein